MIKQQMAWGSYDNTANGMGVAMITQQMAWGSYDNTANGMGYL